MKKKKVVFNKYSLFAHHSECRGANTIIKSSFFITNNLIFAKYDLNIFPKNS